jgi:hypothetical protein
MNPGNKATIYIDEKREVRSRLLFPPTVLLIISTMSSDGGVTQQEPEANRLNQERPTTFFPFFFS